MKDIHVDILFEVKVVFISQYCLHANFTFYRVSHAFEHSMIPLLVAFSCVKWVHNNSIKKIGRLEEINIGQNLSRL